MYDLSCMVRRVTTDIAKIEKSTAYVEMVSLGNGKRAAAARSPELKFALPTH